MVRPSKSTTYVLESEPPSLLRSPLTPVTLAKAPPH